MTAPAPKLLPPAVVSREVEEAINAGFQDRQANSYDCRPYGADWTLFTAYERGWRAGARPRGERP